MQEQLPTGVAVTRMEVLAIGRDHLFAVQLSDGSTRTAGAVLLAAPAYVASTLVAGVDPELAKLCSTIHYVPSVNVALGYTRESIGHALQGWGFVVPVKEGRHVRSASWVSSKWPGRAPAGHALIRASLDGAREGPAIDRRLASIPGLFISASGFRGIGLPDCISDASAVAAPAAAYVHGSSTGLSSA